jgi:hypothetical protein
MTHAPRAGAGFPVVTAEVDVTTADRLRLTLLEAPTHGHATIWWT